MKIKSPSAGGEHLGAMDFIGITVNNHGDFMDITTDFCGEANTVLIYMSQKVRKFPCPEQKQRSSTHL